VKLWLITLLAAMGAVLPAASAYGDVSGDTIVAVPVAISLGVGEVLGASAQGLAEASASASVAAEAH